jgi:23S rRNA (guanine745-N1)-methyltransferase
MPPLLCTVRGCGRKLRTRDRCLVCSRGHSFDVAASGYVNLLGPQDRRSRHPGDSRETALARRRLFEAGHDDGMRNEILAELDGLRPASATAVVLDVGCGEGSLLGSLQQARSIDAHGIDISVPSIELAAKKYPQATWVVGNADRFLPWAGGAFDLVTSITARRNGPEWKRVLKPRGRVLLALPAPDDLIELREALLGRPVRRDRVTAAIDELRPELALISRRSLRTTVSLDEAGIADVLRTTYRGARFRQRDRIGAIGPMDVTLERDILVFQRN